MSSNVIIVCLVVGAVNYLFRYLPLRLGAARKTASSTRPAWINRVLDSIGIASICALLVVSSTPDILRDAHRLLPTLAGFVVLALMFWRSKSIIFSTLAGAVCYGLVFKIMLLSG